MNANLMGFLAILIFSIGTLVYALVIEIPVFQFMVMQFAIGAVSITTFQLIRGKDIIADWKQPAFYYLFVTFGIGLYNVLLLSAFHSAPAFEVNMLNYLWPVLITVLSAVILKTPLKAMQLLGILMGFVGAALLFPAGESGLFEHIQTGHILAILAAFVWALYSVMTKRIHYPSGFLVPIMLIFAAVSMVFHLLYEETVWPSLSIWLLIVLFGITRFCYVLWDYAMRHGDQVLISSASYFTPLISVILFVLFGFKPASPLIAIGGALIVLGCIVTNADQLRKLVKR